MHRMGEKLVRFSFTLAKSLHICWQNAIHQNVFVFTRWKMKIISGKMTKTDDVESRTSQNKMTEEKKNGWSHLLETTKNVIASHLNNLRVYKEHCFLLFTVCKMRISPVFSFGLGHWPSKNNVHIFIYCDCW